MNPARQLTGDYLHKEYPKQFKRDQFWQQIKRTVNGAPVSEADIELIVDQIVNRLDFQACDQLLDLGCGNGALASRFFSKVAAYTGVDFSNYLLDIANEYFKPTPAVQYRAADIRNVEEYTSDLNGVNKVLCYGCISYLSRQDVEDLLGRLKFGLPNLQKVYLGNIPRQKKAGEFFARRGIQDYELNDPASAIGVWWAEGELEELATRVGFIAKRQLMPDHFYGAEYRFDLLLETDVDSCEVDRG